MHHNLSLWDNGWYRFAYHIPSPNFGRRPEDATIDLLVIHSISLPPGEFGGGDVQRLFTNTLDWSAHVYYQSLEGLKVSCHFYIDRMGALWQFVSCNDRAWHAGVSQFQGRSNCNDYSIGIELEGLEGGEFTQEQYDSLRSIGAALLQTYPIAHVLGHEHIAPGRKNDPGAGFNWGKVYAVWGNP